MRLGLLTLLLVLVLPAGAAWAKPRLKLVATNGLAPQAQPGGWLLEYAGDGVRLTNERDGRVIDRRLPEACPSAYALRFPRLLLGCGDDGPAFMDVRTGVVSGVPRQPGSSPGCGGGAGSYSSFGKHWLSTGCADANGTWVGLYLNWRTGEQRRVVEGSVNDDDPARRTYLDLDDPALTERPLLRCPGSSGGFRARPRWVTMTSTVLPRGHLEARRCAGGRPVVLARDAIGSIVRGDRIAWHSPTKISLRDMRTGRTSRWDVPSTDQRGGYTTQISLTERSLWVQVPQGSGPGPSFLVYRARLG